jgi:hypothetical protein
VLCACWKAGAEAGASGELGPRPIAEREARIQ